MHRMTGTRSIRRLALAIALLAVAVLTAGAREPGDITGIWEGAIDVSGTKLGIVVEFKQGANVEWTGDIDIQIQGVKDVPLSNIGVDAGRVHFDMPTVPGNPFFDGALSADGKTIQGDFHQGASVFPFSIMLADEAAAAAQASTLRERLEQLRSFIDTTMHVWQVPGLAVGIVQKGQLVMSEGFGWRSVADSLPVTRATLFAIGSATKAFTTTLIAMRVADGTLSWDEPIRTYLPGFQLKDPVASEHMTLRDLVTHRSGLPRHDAMWYNSPFSRRELIDRLRYLEPNKGFRESFQYQNLMFMTAGYCAGQATKQTWEDAVRQSILDPLKMSRSQTSVVESQNNPDHALPYRKIDDSVTQIPFRDISTIGPAGSINSCVTDMLKWVLFHVNRGRTADSVQLLPAALMDEMHSSQMVVGAPEEYSEVLQMDYGLGWFVEVYRGHKRVHHGGNIDGFTAEVAFLPQDELGIVVLTNLDSSPLPEIVSSYATDLLLGLEPVDFHGRLRTRLAAAEGLQDSALQKQSQEERVVGTKPSHKLEDYAGEYEHPAYGVLTVTYADKKLSAQYNGLMAQLEHWHYDLFKATFPEFSNQKIDFKFLLNDKGDIDRVAVPLEVLVDDIVFVRLPSKQMRDPEFLSRLAGVYELAGQKVHFDVQGDILVAVVPGQPPYPLKPYRGLEFTFKDLNGFSVEFMMKDDRATSVKFKQPNGVFEATRVEEQPAETESKK